MDRKDKIEALLRLAEQMVIGDDVELLENVAITVPGFTFTVPELKIRKLEDGSIKVYYDDIGDLKQVIEEIVVRSIANVIEEQTDYNVDTVDYEVLDSVGMIPSVINFRVEE